VISAYENAAVLIHPTIAALPVLWQLALYPPLLVPLLFYSICTLMNFGLFRNYLGTIETIIKKKKFTKGGRRRRNVLSLFLISFQM
jgi:hypothetical protein